jgi:putative methyltransferase (TIGR04325 family)
MTASYKPNAMPSILRVPVRGTNQRPRGEILAAIDDRTLSPQVEKKALVKAALDFGPVTRFISLAKSIPAYRDFLADCLPARIKYRGVYASFEEARTHAPKRIPLGFDHEEIALGYKNQKFLCSDYPAAYWLREALQDGPTVIDLGGSVGISFFGWQNYFRFPQNLWWVVCEVPAVVNAGEKIALERNEDRLHFISQIEQAEDCNCFLASGSLQYMETSLPEILQRLTRLPQHLIVNRVPLHGKRECITLQNVRWAVSPYRIFQRDAFVAGCEALGYDLVDAWTVPDHNCWIPFYPEFSVPVYSGLYFRKDNGR